MSHDCTYKQHVRHLSLLNVCAHLAEPRTCKRVRVQWTRELARKLCTPAPQEIEDWQSVAPSKNFDLHSDLCKARVKYALLSLHARFADEEAGLRLMQKPTKGVFAGRNFPAGKLRIVPASGMVVLADAAITVPNSAINLGIAMKHPTKGTDIAAHIVRHAQLPQKAGGFLTPYWFVRSVASEEEANLETQMHTVTVAQSIMFEDTKHVVKRTKSAQQDTVKDQDFTVKVPLLVNSRAIKAGDELLYYKAAAPKRPSTVAVLPDAKRCKAEASK